MEGVARNPGTAGVDQRSDLALLNALVGLEVDRTVALLKADGDALLRAGLASSRHGAAAACVVDADRFFAIDVLPALDGGLEHARVLEGWSGDEDGVDGGVGEQLLKIGVGLRVGDLDRRFRFFDAVVELIAQGGDRSAGIGVDDAGVITAASAAADQADRDLGVGLRAADGLRGDNREGGSGGQQAAAREDRG